MVAGVNRIAATGGSEQSSLKVAVATVAGESRICSSQPAVRYTMWPTCAAAAYTVYALAFEAARMRVIELERIRHGHATASLASVN
jgi:hypothetical protein